jgi:hypothetical protein
MSLRGIGGHVAGIQEAFREGDYSSNPGSCTYNCSCRNTVEMYEIVALNLLNLQGTFFALSCLQRLGLWKKCLLS